MQLGMNRGGLRRVAQTNNANAASSGPSGFSNRPVSPPIANSTVIGTNGGGGVFLNDSADQFFNDSTFQQHHTPAAPTTTNNNFFRQPSPSQMHPQQQAFQQPQQSTFLDLPSQNNMFNPAPANNNNSNVPYGSKPSNRQNLQNGAQNSNPNFFNPNKVQHLNNAPSSSNATPQMRQQGQQPVQYFNPLQNNMLSDPVASMAVNYGSSLANQGKEYVTQNVDRWFSIPQLRYYFAVDTSYVTKKLLILLFPFTNRDWSIRYSQDEVVTPRMDVNVPDMYIPVMAFVTYLLMVGLCLGTHSKFSPEQLGINASSALGWLVFEFFLIFISLQVLSIKSVLSSFDILAYCGYKYFAMIICLAASLITSSSGYYAVLAYMCVAMVYFMVRNLKLKILSNEGSNPGADPQYHQTRNKRRIYVLLVISLMQPFFIWWLTRHLIAV